MTDERMLLQQIREKELEISVRLEDARREAEQEIARARQEGADLLVRADAEACRESDRRADDVIGQVQAEIDAARQRGLDEDREIRRRGEEHMAAAVDEIVRGVLRE